MTSVERLDGGPFAVGCRAQVRQPKLRPAVWQVTEFEDKRNFTWTARSAGLCMTAGHLIEPHGAASRVVLSFELSGFLAPVVLLLYGGLIERYATTESQGLRKRCASVL